MAVQTDFLPAGHDVTDEKVVCSLPVVIGETTYYAGYLQELAGEQFIGLLSDEYGAWTAVDQGGDRFLVVQGGVPGADDACVDRTTGRVLCTVENQTLYFRYVGYRKIFNSWERHVEINFPGVLVDGDIAAIPMPRGGGFRSARFALNNAPVGESITLSISDGVGAGEEITFATTETEASVEFTNRLKFQPGDTLYVTVESGAALSLPCGLIGVVEAG